MHRFDFHLVKPSNQSDCSCNKHLRQELINTKQDVSQTRVSALSAPAEGAGYILAPGKAQPDLWENADSVGCIMGL